MKQKPILDIYTADSTENLEIPLVSQGISAGFPSPAEDYIDRCIDLNKELIKNSTSTFLGRVKGFSMQDAGIFDGDILVIDKALQPKHGNIAVCFLDGEFTLKRIQINGKQIFLMPENKNYSPIQLKPENDFYIWGIVTYIIKKV